MAVKRLVAAIEAGGTKTICALGSSLEDIRNSEKLVVPTTTPLETMTRIFDWFDEKKRDTTIESFGVATFGPIDFATGAISASSPKLAWRNVSWVQAIRKRYGEVPIGFDTDVNGAGIAESRWGVSKGRTVSAYLTVGTGIGGAVIINSSPVHGMQHPEIGHMYVPLLSEDDYAGSCPSHGTCFEGVASGTAIEARWGMRASDIPSDHIAWEMESTYLAEGIANVIAVVSPEIIVLAGGIMSARGLLDRVGAKTESLLGNYFDTNRLGHGLDEYIVSPVFGNESGVIGASALAFDALRRSSPRL